jgi:hypothetical protein
MEMKINNFVIKNLKDEDQNPKEVIEGTKEFFNELSELIGGLFYGYVDREDANEEAELLHSKAMELLEMHKYIKSTDQLYDAREDLGKMIMDINTFLSQH